MRKILITALTEYKRFLFGKSFWLMIFSVVFYMEQIVRPIAGLASESGIMIGKFEPFIYLLSSPIQASIIPIMFIVMLSGFPDYRSSGIFIMVRNTRLSWLIGEFIYAILVGITYLACLMIGCLIYLWNTGAFLTEWSPYMTVFSTLDPERYAKHGDLFIEISTVTQGSLLTVLGTSFLYMMGYLMILALTLSLFNLIEKKWIGFWGAILVTGIASVTCNFAGKFKWIFPMSHAIFGLHFREFYAREDCPLWVSAVYFSILIVMLLTLNLLAVKKVRIGDESE